MSQAAPAPAPRPVAAAAAVASGPPTSATRAAPPPTAPAALPAVAPAAGPVVSDTPRRLRALNTAVLWLGVAFALAGLVSFLLLTFALGRAGDSTAQLIRVQQIQTSLLSADATASNAFLVGGLEPTAQRQAYDQAIDTASTLIAQAARAEPADEQALSTLNEQLVAYTASIEQARANNRQGFPIGAQYLRSASSTLRADALPVLDNLVGANAERARSQMDVNEAWLFGVVGLVTLAGLVLTQLWLARRFHRRLNPALVAATAVALATWLGLVVLAAQVGAKVGDLRDSAFTDVNAVATARIQAFNAKSNESLTLIARGSGSSFEKAWAASSAAVQSNVDGLPGGLSTSWTSYRAVHTQIRKLDDGGQWDQAVRLATSSEKTASNATFTTFDTASAGVLTERSRITTTGLGGTRVGLVIGAVVALLAGLAVAVLGRRGVGARLREYR